MEGIEQIYELSPMQQAMLFHSLYAPGSGVYELQMSLRLTGRLDIDAFERAWRHVVERHAILRTAFFWEDLEKPVQVVYPRVDLPLTRDSWCCAGPDEQRARLERYLEADRERGFDPSEAPLMRLALFELGPSVHQLVWSVHHLLVDGWSQSRLLRELFASYAAFSEGREPDLERAGSFRDYIAWLQRQDLGQAEAFWRRSLAAFTAPTLLAGGNGRAQGHGGARRHDRHLPVETTGALRVLARRHRLTLNTLVQGAWALLLAQETGREDVVFGTTVSGRPAELPGVEAIVGLFINTLPLRVEVQPESHLPEWLAELQRRHAEARRYEHAPLVEVQRWSELPAGTPLFDHLLVFENLAFPAELSRPVPDLEIAEEASHALTSDAMSLIVIPGGPGDGLTLSVRSDAARLEATAVLRIVERLAALLTALAEDGVRRVGDLPLLLPAERHQVLVEWNDTGAAPTTGISLHGLFAAQAARTPGAVALVHGTERLTYAELAARADDLACRLRQMGAGPEVRIAVCLERTPDLIGALLGVLKAGSAYVPIDPAYPAERQTLMLEDSGAAILVTHGGLQRLDEGSKDSQDTGESLPGHLAYLIYTSGSTGRPKAVAIEHRSAVALAGWARETFSDEELSGVVAATSVCFDLSVFEIFVPLALGGTILLADNALALPGLPAAGEARLLNTVPSAAAELVRSGGLPPSVRTVSLAGEPLPADLAARLYATGSVRRVLNLYGPSEDTTYSTVALVPRNVERPPAIGRPIRGTRTHVVDRRGSLVPPGVAGELWLAGDGLARNYLGRPELTAERFTPDPFGGPGERVYRTGDLVRCRPDGELEFLGRIDHQVKVRGFRIEPGEIETVLRTHPSVRDGVVLARESRLTAYVVGVDGLADTAVLRSFLVRRLPGHMVPSSFVLLDALPLSPNGKIDRKALPDPESPSAGDGGAGAPSDPVEELLAGVWAEVLGLDRVGVHDHFFSLGGHSLLATRVASRIRGVLGVDLPLRALFEAPTVAELARVVRESGTESTVPPILPVPRDGHDLPLSFAQQRLWVIDQLDPGSPAYNIPSAVRLTGEVSPALLERIFAEVARRHEALRTTFAAHEGVPVQVIADTGNPELTVVDLSSLPAAERERQALRLSLEEARRPFDLRRGPLLRLGLVRLAAQVHLLLLTLHHIVSDGWSMGVLLREIAALAEAFSQGRPSPLAELPVQYADFAVWQRGWLEGEELAVQLDHWKRRLTDAPRVLELPTDRPRAARPSHRGATRPFDLPPALYAEVRQLCRREGVTPFMALLAAWATVLGRHADQQDLLVGSPVANRNRREIEDLIGFFVNTLVLRIEPGRASTFRELLERVRSTALDAFAHQDLPFERLVEELVPERDLAHSPLFQVMLVLQNAPARPLSIPGLTLEPLALESQVAKLDLLLHLSENGDGGLSGSLEHSTELFDEGWIVRLLQHLGVLLTAAAAEPDRPLAMLPLLTPEERNRVLFEWNDNAEERPRVVVHAPVEEQVESTPDALAAVWAEDGAGLTYLELNRRANQLAHHLRSLGVGSDERVALCLERSLDQMVAVLGVLKAGGAYVPVDPDYPADRVAFMLADSRSRVLVDRTFLDSHREAIAACSTENPVRRAAPENLAYVIYTSGSTGRPKGVAMPHGALANLLAWQRTASASGPGVRTLQLASLSFDVSFQEIFSTWWTGGTLVGIPQETRRDARALCQVLAGQRIARLFLPFVALQQIAEAIEHGAPLPEDLAEIVTAGEQLQITRPIAGWLERSGALLENQYGPTEGHVVSVHRLSGPPAAWPVLPPIGRPLPNVRMYLLDRSFGPVPQGVPGLLFFGGAQVVRGYLDRPGLTAEKLVPDPFGPEPGARLYATGDLARYRADGALQYLGRVDQQVKIRGFRVEPGEVESALARHPGVREAAVVVRGEGLSRRLVGYYSADPSLTAGTLRASLAAELPEPSMPAILVRLDALPLTPSGKLDRRSLPDPQILGAADASQAEPADPVEDLLAGIWAEVLGRDRIGVRDDFFALGGHSLLATQVMSRVRTVLGADLPLRQLFETPTVEGFARAVRAAGPQGAQPAPPLVPAPRRGDLPLSFAQQRLWLIDQLEPGSPAYNIPQAVHLRGELSVELLERIFAEIVRRHEALRTTFAPRAEQPIQVIASVLRPEVPVVDLSRLPDAQREAVAGELAREEARRPFDLRRGPLLRLALLRLGAQDHVLLLTLHHAVSDGWSMGVLLREIAALHEAFVQGRPSPLPELPVQYADFAVWQRAWLQGAVLEEQIAACRRRLADAPRVLELPTDRPRPAVQTSRGAARPLDLPPSLGADLRHLCRQAGATPFMALLAAWAILLGRHADRQDLLVGSPIAGRNRREVEDLIGFFVNTLVLRVRPDSSLTFLELLHRVREEALDAFGHQDLPFERLVEELVSERDLAHSPLFQVLFVLQNASSGTLSIPGLTLTPLALETGLAKLDLTLAVQERQEREDRGFEAALAYKTDLFDGSTVARLGSRFAVLLAAAVAFPERPLPELPLLAPAERHQALLEWNDTARLDSAGALLHELVAAQAARRPDAVAAVLEDDELTYGELERRANRLAHHLTGLGVAPDDRVGVLLERSLEMIVGLLGILKAGAAYVPLDPAWPAERLARLVEDAGARVVLDANAVFAWASSLMSLKPLMSLSSEGLAYTLFTSGSTGKPKGVMIPHRGIVNRLLWEQERFHLTPEDRFLQKTPSSFDVSVWEIFWPLLAGARLVLARPEGHRDPAYLVDLVAREGISVIHFVPSMLQAFLEAPGVSGLSSLRRVMLGGEALSRELMLRLLTRLPGVEAYNRYGPTEASVSVSVAACGRAGSVVSIGRPIANLRLLVVDRELRLQPPGVPGELVLGGAGLARGYLGRPDLTAAAFVPDPLGEDAGERLYRTGDLARLLPDGTMEILGRIDHQVKVRGFRIEPGEIEAVLGSHPAVRECVVVQSEGVLVAYVVLDPTDRSDRSDPPKLSSWLHGKLPTYMVPSAFVLLDALPLTASGKVDRRALPEPERTGSADARASSDPVEQLLASIWSEVLGVDCVGLHDDFFSLGGHSLLATRVVSRVRGTFEVDLPLRRLFETPTVAGLARAVRESRTGTAAPAIVPVARTGELPLSFAQQRLWLIDQLDPGSPAYNIPSAVRLRGEAAPGLLERIFAEVLRRHEALRTTFAAREGVPVQVIAEARRPELPVVDLSGLPAAPRERQALRLALEEARRPFDLRHGPLLRLGLVRLAAKDHLLLLTLHHIVSDGWSRGVLLREIAALAEAFSQSRPSPLPELPVQYADFAVWQRGVLQGEVLEAQLAFWRDRLAGAPRLLELPTDRPRPAVQTQRGGTRSMTLTPPVSEAVRALCRQEGVTLFMALLAAWATVLGRHAGQDDVLVGSPIAGRNRREIEELIGFFVNTLVLRIEPAPTFRGLLERVRATALDAYAHQDLPFERLVEELVPERDLSHAPLVQVLFALQNVPGQTVSLPGLALEAVSLDLQVAKLDLDFALAETPSGLSGNLGYNTSLFDSSTAARLLACFEVLLDAAARDPEQPLSALPLLGPAERHQTLREWNDRETPCPQRPLVHELLSLHARRRPEAVAVDGVAGRLTYGELEARSNRLAHHLRRLGVGPEVPVALCTERTPERVVGIVAVLKAGGAYVSLDPTYPRDRLAFLLEDARAPVLLTQERFLTALPETGAHLICLDAGWPRIEGPDDRAPVTGVGPDNLAYVVYTSGSTGRPKGVEIPHAGLMNLVRWHQDLYQVQPEDRATQIASPAFDASIWELWPYLAAGASVHIPDEETRLSAPGMIRWWSTQGITLAYLMTPLAEGVLEEKIPPDQELRVRALIIGGDRLHRRPDPEVTFRLMNHYGPAEYTVTSTVVEVPPRGEETGLPTIGRPVDNTQIYLLDRHLEPVPIGVPGELFVAGTGIARGYLRRPELTAEKFVPHPFSAEPGARMYRTADLVRSLPDGDMDFLGRLDHQVKIRGLRIELGEIESLLAQHPGVREAAVLAREDRPGQKRLVAYVVPAAGEPPVQELRRFLEERLPEYMVPPAFVALESLPLTANGKVDRRALPAPEQLRDGPDETSAAPSNPVEELLAGIWGEVLGPDRVGIHDDFFALGGHSLLATQVVSRARSVLGVDLPLRALFEAPTVAGLAARIEREGIGLIGPIRPIPRTQTELPLSLAQQRLWIVDRLEPGSPAYNLPFAVRLSGALSGGFRGLLERVFTEIARRHEILRTSFAAREAGPVQVIAAEPRIELPLVDLSHLPGSLQAARALTCDEARRPFDLQRGPLLRLTLVRLAAEEHILLLTMHHIVSDGWSMGVLLREVAALAGAFSQGRPSPLPELPVQYADFAVWQREWLQGEVLEAQLGFWKRQLAGAPRALELPLDRPRPPRQTWNGALYPVVLPPDLSEAVRRLSRRQAVTPFMALLAAWALLLGRHASQDDVVIGSPVAGRNRLETEALIGFFLNTLALRIRLEGSTFAALLARARQTALDAFAHQDLPFERIVEEVAPERDPAVSPLFQAWLMLQNAPLSTLAVPGLALSPLEVDTGLAKFELALNLGESPAGFSGALGFNTDLFDGSTALRLLARFTALLEAAAEDPDRAIADLPLLLPVERFQTLVEENDTDAPCPETGLHELIAAQATRTPEAVAVVASGGPLTYGELMRRTHRLAHFLIEIGVAPEERVGVLLERSPELLVGLLGILAAGAAYVPLDPASPPERLAGLLEGAGITRVLSREWPWSEIARQPDTAPAVRPLRLNADRLAYVLYTSGSTGAPKGVMVEHRSVVNYLTWCIRAYGLAPGKRSLVHSPLGFDLTVTSLFAPLLAGGTVELLPEGPGVDELSRALREHRDVQLLKLTPAHLEALGRELEPEAARRVAVLVVGGEALFGPALAPWQTASPGTLVVNEYGPTEATVGCSFLAFPAAETPAGRVPIGRAITNARLYVVDRDLRPLPPGARGELCIGGVLARGYLGRPDLTAERFVPDPFGASPGARLYRTGDLVFRRADGNLAFLGRNDHQVKIRGFRIEPGEIEAALARHPAVRECVVVARDGALVAYLVLHRTDRTDPTDRPDLSAWLRERLPDYMLPSAFVFLEALPLTPNGKVDRKALPAPERTGGQDRLGPRDALELQLVRIWEEVLGLQPIGIRDDFFALGGHSLLVIQVTSRIRKSLGRRLPLASLLRHPTVERLAAFLREGAEPLHRNPLVELAPGSGRPLFLVHPVGGEVLCYVPLARRLGRPVHGLQAQEGERSLEETAALYLRHVREVQPEGPYLLGGWSLGGAVAYEMARQLEREGAAVERVILIDSIPPGDSWRTGITEAALVAGFGYDLARLLGIGGAALPEGFSQYSRDEALAWLGAQAEQSGLLPPGLGVAELERRCAMFAANYRAMARYEGGSCAARLLLLRAAERSSGASGEPGRDWGRIAGQKPEVHEVPGDHYTLLQEPMVESLGSVLKERLGAFEGHCV